MAVVSVHKILVSSGTPKTEKAYHISVTSLNYKIEKPAYAGYLFFRKPIDLIGRGGEIRTPDPLHPMQVRYQAALRPEGANYSRAKIFLGAFLSVL